MPTPTSTVMVHVVGSGHDSEDLPLICSTCSSCGSGDCNHVNTDYYTRWSSPRAPFGSTPAPPSCFLRSSSVRSPTTSSHLSWLVSLDSLSLLLLLLRLLLRPSPAAAARGDRYCRKQCQSRGCPCSSISFSCSSPPQNSTTSAPGLHLLLLLRRCHHRRRRHRHQARAEQLRSRLLLRRRTIPHPHPSRAPGGIDAVSAASPLQRLPTLHLELVDQLNSPP